ncbi:type VI secretion system protein TssA [Salmonella enterica subsp. enterica]|nr:type VI secretion system protein TssA [Salmonella enterica subsp. enterica serovar Typhimurium]EHP3225507.1 type VI secretion system protein TssA [Salmonella enterica subsp. enterica serovar Newport]
MTLQSNRDITDLLAPVSVDNPTGENIEYEPVIDEIRRAQESDMIDHTMGEWTVCDPKEADWQRVHDLCKQVLIYQSKDLQVACWLVESVYHLQGLAGLSSGISFLGEFLTRFWSQLWPMPEDNDMAVRRSKLIRLDRNLSYHILHQPLLKNEFTSLLHWRRILNYERKKNKLLVDNQDEDGVHYEISLEDFERQAINFSYSEICEQLNYVEDIIKAINDLEKKYTSLSLDSEGTNFDRSCQLLSEAKDYLQRLELRTMPPQESSDRQNGAQNNNSPGNAIKHNSNGQITSREEAINQMLAIASYFNRNEPSSPIPLLMLRASRWANMTLTEWLEEMINDDNCINNINNVLTGKKLS